MTERPGHDRRAVHHPATPGAPVARGRSAIVIGGGIAGLSAATALSERGVQVTLLEREATWGGRVRSWSLPDGRSMSRGFHAFFRQYYTLRGLLKRADPALARLNDIGDYPLRLADGPTDSFRGIPRTPPWSVAAFALRSKSFPLRELARVRVPEAMGLLRVSFPETFAEHDGESAADFLDRLRFPSAARHLALEVFARSFFADPREFSAGELIGMFHAYFMGSAEGLIFDVPVDSYSPTLWNPLADLVRTAGGVAETGITVTGVRVEADEDAAAVPSRAAVTVTALDARGRQHTHTADSVVIAADPRGARELIAGLELGGGVGGGASASSSALHAWRASVAAQRNAPRFAVWRLWLDRLVAAPSPAFLGTSGYGPLDNISVLERFERTAAGWSREHGGSVIELHAYALAADATETGVREELWRQLLRVHPELADATIVADELLIEQDCPLIGLEPWASRPTITTPDRRVVVAGDWLRTDEPVALMERAALTGLQAANALLRSWGVTGHDWWSVPLRGVLRRR